MVELNMDPQTVGINLLELDRFTASSLPILGDFTIFGDLNTVNFV